MRITAKYSGIVKLLMVMVILPVAVLVSSVNKSILLTLTVKDQQERIIILSNNNNPGYMGLNAISPEDSDPWLKNGGLLNTVDPLASLCGITVESYVPYLTASNGGAELYTGELTLGGDFISLTRLLGEIEKHPGPAGIVSVSYRTYDMPRATRGQKLRMTVIFQEVSIPQTEGSDEK